MNPGSTPHISTATWNSDRARLIASNRKLRQNVGSGLPSVRSKHYHCVVDAEAAKLCVHGRSRTLRRSAFPYTRRTRGPVTVTQVPGMLSGGEPRFAGRETWIPGGKPCPPAT